MPGMTQSQAVINTLERLGGIATLGQLYSEVLAIKECQWKTKTPFASIRRIVQQHKEIYKISAGLYGLVKLQPKHKQDGILASSNQASSRSQNFTHTYYQGLLLHIGNKRGFLTFAPQQDKNRLFLDKDKLSEIRTLDLIPPFSYKDIVKRSETIDAIWFNERRMPHSFFEIENSTDMQNSLIKFSDLQDFSARMIIVADGKRRAEFDKKLSASIFKEIQKSKRVRFMSYEQIAKEYEMELEKSCYETPL